VQNKRIVITGGPGTGKSAVINNLESKGHYCFHEISRQITLEAQEKGIDQLFLNDPLLFSEKLLEARIRQFQDANEPLGKLVFLDRGIPDVIAYLNYFGGIYPSKFGEACNDHKYNRIFLMPPWDEIYETDNERYESFEQAQNIYAYLKKAYITHGYNPIEVPKQSIESRCEFILNNLDA
jgi:predicted ATPase